jgi:Fic family protein
MSVFKTPKLSQQHTEVIQLIEELHSEIEPRVAEPRRWVGGLRRVYEARAAQASNSIEGINASLDDILAVIDDDEPMDADTETRLAIEGFQEAMTYVLQIAHDPELEINESLVKALHYMMLKYDLSKSPGRWRPGPIYVERSYDHAKVYTGPDVGLVPELMAEMFKELNKSAAPTLVKAAMAHLNLVMVHPFRDGNGRMARCLQTLVLAREQMVAPVFSSIEDYLGPNTRPYYDILAAVGQGSWHPSNDALPWVDFCLTAHYRQARAFLRRIHAWEEMWNVASQLAKEKRLPERVAGPLTEAAYGLRIRRATYLNNVKITWGEEIAPLSASRDLKALVTAGLLQPIGDTRGRHYLATDALRAEWERIRGTSPKDHDSDNPFAIVEERAQLQLDVATA